MKVLERLVLRYLKTATQSLLDPHQFAYRANRSVEDAVCLGRAPINAQMLRTKAEKDTLNLGLEGLTGRTKKVPGYGVFFIKSRPPVPN